VAEEWRVRLIFNDHSGASKKSYYRTTLRDLLRSRFGGAIVVSADKMLIFLYAGTADAAEWAERVAREVLAQQNLSADFRLERWDPSGPVWRVAQAEAPDLAIAELPAADEDNPKPRRVRSAATKLVGGVVEFVADGIVNNP
jgi:hypothetical protein